MRHLLAIAILVLAAAPAHADDNAGLSLDLGYMWDHVQVTDQTVVSGQAVRFAIRIAVSRHFHFGGEAEESRLSGSTPIPDGQVARTTSMTVSTPVEGMMIAPKFLVGAHAISGRLTAIAELAGGFRDTELNSIYGYDIAGRKKEALVEGRTQLDYWLSPAVTVGAMASTDVLTPGDVSFGLLVGLHFAPYDHAR
jgi:hypothetical protein